MNITDASSAVYKHINSSIKLERISAGHYKSNEWEILKIKHKGGDWWCAKHPEKDSLVGNTLSEIKRMIYFTQ